MVGVELRLSDVNPPAPDPPRSIYADLVNLPDPVKLGLTVRIFNYDDVALYMKVDGFNSAWTFTSNDLGSIASGGNAYFNLDQFGSRAKPTSVLSEQVTVRLRAYTDAGYTNLKWTFERVIDIIFIKSDDGSWTTDFLNNFDDGTVQGWAAVGEENCNSSCAAATDYVLSAPYSLKTSHLPTSWGGGKVIRGRHYKSFTTPDRNYVYLIADLRFSSEANAYMHNYRVQRDGTVLIFIGKPWVNLLKADQFPRDRWMRVCALLPRNTTLEVRFVVEMYEDYQRYVWVWMDDFKIISKN